MSPTFFILSDLHAIDGATDAAPRTSYFDISLPDWDEANNPIAALNTLINKRKIKADFLICCGDIGDKACPTALTRAWEALQKIKVLLGAKQIITTVGNHDVDSRHKHNDHDAKGVLLDLNPQYPFESDELNNHFWTHHFTVFPDEAQGIRFAVVNSSGYHGEAEEHVHGRVSKRTLRRLLTSLERGGRFELNVLICHHHPQKHADLSIGSYDDMQGGYELLSALNSAAFGPWIIFHGHKHHPKISYAQGGNCTPVIFSAASCAAIPYPEIAGSVRNQVYLVSFEMNRSLTSTCCGKFLSWDWAPGRGWDQSQAGSGLPGCGGFGFRGDIGELAEQINTQFPTEAKWEEIIRNIPNVTHLLPSDLQQLCLLLRSQCGFKIEEGKNGNPILVQK